MHYILYMYKFIYKDKINIRFKFGIFIFRLQSGDIVKNIYLYVYVIVLLLFGRFQHPYQSMYLGNNVYAQSRMF